MTSNNSKKIFGLSGSRLKIIAMIIMIIDHCGAVLMDRYFQTEAFFTLEASAHDRITCIYILIRAVGRMAFPIFVFLLIEGFNHTHSYKGYIKNLGLFAMISEVPFDLAITGKIVSWDYQNVFFTLFIGMIVVWYMDKMGRLHWNKNLTPLYYLAASFIGSLVVYILHSSADFGENFPLDAHHIGGGIVVGIIVAYLAGKKLERVQKISVFFMTLPMIAGFVVAEMLRCDYGGVGIFTICLMYVFCKNHKNEDAFSLSIIALGCLNVLEFAALLARPLIRAYNGERGLKLKYVFYFFYPVHLLILYAIGFGIFGQ